MGAVVALAAATGAAFGALGLAGGVTLFGSAILGGAALFGGLALVSSFLAPKAGDFGLGTGSGAVSVGTQRPDTRQLVRAAVQPARWAVGRAKVRGSLLYYHEKIGTRKGFDADDCCLM